MPPAGPDRTNLSSTPDDQSNGATVPIDGRRLRHDIRNHLNAIKLNCAILHRRHAADAATREALNDMERASDDIDRLITQMTEPAGAPPSV